MIGMNLYITCKNICLDRYATGRRNLMEDDFLYNLEIFFTFLRFIFQITPKIKGNEIV